MEDSNTRSLLEPFAGPYTILTTKEFLSAINHGIALHGLVWFDSIWVSLDMVGTEYHGPWALMLVLCQYRSNRILSTSI